MSKEKKQSSAKPRPVKYEPKVAINATFEQTLGMFADHANKKVKESQSKPKQ